MARLRFLAPSADPRPGQEGIVYGPQHQTDFDESDYEYIKSLLLEGKAEIIDATGLPQLLPPTPEAA